MNQLYRALHMPPARLVKKLAGWKEIYTIALRPVPTAPGCDPLPALGEENAYTPLPGKPGIWYADPLLFSHEGKRWLFCEAFDMAKGKGDIAVIDLTDPRRPGTPQTVLSESFHLSFPTVFEWNREIWMIPETGTNHSLNLYRCKHFPDQWELAASFLTGDKELADTILLDIRPGGLALLCSQVKADNGLYTRYRRYELRREEGAEGGFVLEEDETFGLENRLYDLGARNAGPLFRWAGQTVRPAQVSTKVDYGVYLQFWTRRDEKESPLCAAMPANVRIEGVDPASIIGIHTYCRDEEIEIIDARYLAKVTPVPTPKQEDSKSC